MADLDVINAVIGTGQSLSAQVNLGNKTLVGIAIPTGWITASLSFQASADGGQTFGELVDETATAKGISSITGGAYTVIAVDPKIWRGINCIKVRSGTAAAAVNQTAAAGVTLQLLTRMVY